LALQHVSKVRAVGRRNVENTERNRRHLGERLLLDGVGSFEPRSLVRGGDEIGVETLDFVVGELTCRLRKLLSITFL